MQVKIEDLSSVKKTLHIEISQEDVSREIDKAYLELKKSVKIKGFRPGKAPRSVLERRFKKDVHADVSSRLIQESFVDAVKQTDLKIVGNPRVDPPDLVEDAPYRYAAHVEISPEIGDVDFRGLKLKRKHYRVSEGEIDAQLKALQKNLARQEKLPEDRPAAEGDFVLIDYEGFRDGKPHSETIKTTNFTMKLGDGHISKPFDEQISGMEAGESKKFGVSFPENHFNPKLAGLDLEFEVLLREIRQEVLPEVDDAMARKAGAYENLDELKNAISENLNQGYQKRQEQELNEQVFTALIERTDFEVPDALVDMELEGIIEEAERSFAYRNTSLEEMGLSREAIAEKYRETALNQVRRHLILGRMIEQEALALADGELEEAMREMASNFNQPLEQIQKFYAENPERQGYLKHALLEKKAIKLIIESSAIEDVPAENTPGKPGEENAPAGP
jgi:trigger factor